MVGKHIELFLVDGEPGGITTANVSGWTGHVLAGPRTALTRLLARDEAHRNGVYLLLGEDPESIDSTRCYIGRTEDFSMRFRQHDRKKDWWDRAVLISSKEDSFNEGHWGYLEARLVDIARRAERSSLPDNLQTPQLRKLSEAQISDVEAFLDQIHGILPVLGVHVLRTATGPEPEDRSDPVLSPVFTLVVPRRGVEARARVIGEEFVMLAGSHVVGAWNAAGRSEQTRRAYDSYRARHAKLVADGSIVVEGAIGVLTRDVPFTSPSTAGAVATGAACNGRRSWKTDGMAYGDWENRDLAVDQPSAPSPIAGGL
ncbi:GIY-YIG nuclease family protein [Actinomyces howellii]|uniref:DUF4357 domain-containing protein n=1 Tax=Actinomyces howellii TaxID=52771 RepID=A0A3S4UW85_9ACTO|nr:GIY-YIG nuclease family protein [Actinomyces howellii]VEG26576.1 Uncharacterised protein [Actinomyces howellii]